MSHQSRGTGSAAALLTAAFLLPLAAVPARAACGADADTACLLSGRFAVEVGWTTAGSNGAANVMSFNGARAESDQSAFFWFFDNANFEMGVKMVDACSFNDSFWVFVSGLTNQAFEVTIQDTVTLETRTYSNPLGTYPQTIGATDGVSGFDCTPGGGALAPAPTPDQVRTLLAAAPADPLAARFPAAALAAAAPAPAPREHLVNALPSVDFPATGMLLTPEGGCGGTLIGCSSFLTAASCICGQDLTGEECLQANELLALDDKQVFLPHYGVFGLAGITIHSDYQFALGHDLALITLAEAVPGAAPTLLATGDEIGSGLSATLVGYGATGGLDFSFGIRRAGQGVTAACSIVPDDDQVCVQLTAPLGAPGTESGLCLGDGGASLLISQGGVQRLAGVGSGTTSLDCQPPGESFFADVPDNRAWIEATAGADLGTSACGAAPIGGGSTSSGSTDSLAGGDDDDTFAVEVPAGTQQLRATLVGDLFGPLDGDLYARAGAQPTVTEFDAASQNPSTIESIVVDAPAAGTWNFLAHRFDGEGAYQLVVTLLAPSGEPTVCVADADTACQLGGRFQVEVDWTTLSDGGAAQVMSFDGQRAASDQSSFWWFFDAANFEMGVKMVDACVPPFDAYWVFVSGLTNQAYDVAITDTHSGLTRHYRNPLGQYPQTIGATGADTGFPCTQ